ncbi:hypothetical protein DHX103_02610 [Planococcus sp. X10-3]|uniref:hypothetical protein n=1 Tax=Planococcus sp. X10-3 TaxID=3061240 RepID=UPI003BB1074B
MNNYYVYAHKIPLQGDIFYIGSNYRAGNFRRAYGLNSRPEKWKQEVKRHNNLYDVEILAVFDNRQDALKYELKMMKYYQENKNWCWCNGENRSDETIWLLRNSSVCRKILSVKNDKQQIFDSIRFASKELNIPRSTIHHYINTGKKHPAGYYFKYFS